MIAHIDTKYDLSKVDIFQNEQDCIVSVLSYILGKTKNEIRLMSKITLTESEQEKLDYVLDMLCNKKVPFQYIVGKVKVYNEEYIVTPDVLIPRQDTECIIEQAINHINKHNLRCMLDLCTGSGVIGISVAKNSDIINVDMSDISEQAIKIAKENIELNGVQNKCNAFVSDLFTMVIDKNSKYDIITANPPYISYEEYLTLSTYVKQEPQNALVAENNGLHFYIKIASESKKFLNNNGWLLFEIGYNQAEEVKDILGKEGYENIQIIKDLNLNDRVVVCRFQNK